MDRSRATEMTITDRCRHRRHGRGKWRSAPCRQIWSEPPAGRPPCHGVCLSSPGESYRRPG